MFSLLIAGITPVIAATSKPLPQQHAPIIVTKPPIAKPILISGLGQGFCWAQVPYPNGKVTKLTNDCGGGGEGKKDISCSPFTYRPFQFNLDHKTANPCGGGPYENIVAGAQRENGGETMGQLSHGQSS